MSQTKPVIWIVSFFIKESWPVLDGDDPIILRLCERRYIHQVDSLEEIKKIQIRVTAGGKIKKCIDELVNGLALSSEVEKIEALNLSTQKTIRIY